LFIHKLLFVRNFAGKKEASVRGKAVLSTKIVV